MKEQLKLLAQDQDGKFHAILRGRVGKRATRILETRLKQIIVLMPDLVEKIYSYWQSNKTPTETKKLGSYLLTYMYLPNNFISQKEWGLFGYLDDAYFVSKMFTAVIEDLQAHGCKVRSEDLIFYEEIKMLKQSVRIVIPKESLKIDEMIRELSNGKQEQFFKLVGQAQ